MIIELSKLKAVASFIEEASRGLPEGTFNKLSKPEQEEYCKKHPNSRYAKEAVERDLRRSVKQDEKLSNAQKEANKDAKSDKTNDLKWADTKSTGVKQQFTAQQVKDKLADAFCELHFTKKDGTTAIRYVTFKPDFLKGQKEATDAKNAANPNYKPWSEERKAKAAERAKAEADLWIPYIDVQKYKKDPANSRGCCRADLVTFCKMIKEEDIPADSVGAA